MKTLVVYYSKSGNTKTVAEAVIKNLACDYDKLDYDEKSKAIRCTKKPSDYERVILLSPIWAFSLAEPMKLYLNKFRSEILTYNLIVTCAGLGLRNAIRNCRSAIGKSPEKAIKIRAQQIRQGDFDVASAI